MDFNIGIGRNIQLSPLVIDILEKSDFSQSPPAPVCNFSREIVLGNTQSVSRKLNCNIGRDGNQVFQERRRPKGVADNRVSCTEKVF